MPSIEVSRLRKVFGQTVAVDDLSFSVEPGEVLGFLGPNGAGKSTTMKILCGFIGPSSGQARLEGFDVIQDSLEARRRIGYLPESTPLYGEMQPKEYLDFVCNARSVPRGPVRKQRVEELVDQLGLAPVFHRPIHQLSKGFRQRVGLAQALVHDPPILILDEPTSGLDPNQILDIRDLIRRVGRTKTVVLSTHIMQEVSAVCSRILIVDQGRIVGFGSPAEIEAQAQGGVRIELVVRGEGDIAEVLAGIPGVQSLEESAGEGPNCPGFTLFAGASDDPREAIFRAVAERGWSILELRRESAGLEDAFRVLTGTP